MSALAHEPEPRTTAPADFDIRDHMDGVGAFLAGPANVIMQLGLRPVGYGVVTKPRIEGSAMHHPFKRMRTTFTYLAVSLLGTDDDRLAMREAVDFSHRGVHSDPGAQVKFNAFDPKLQLWVAACLYFGYVDMLATMRGPLDDEVADAIYAESIRFGTTLQMPADAWPADRKAFEEYWRAGLAALEIDPIVRVYLLKLLQFKMVHPVMRVGSGQLMTWTNTGFLPAELREALGLEWSTRDERLFRLTMRALGLGSRLLPRPARIFPFNFFLWDFRRRVRKEKPIV